MLLTGSVVSTFVSLDILPVEFIPVEFITILIRDSFPTVHVISHSSALSHAKGYYILELVIIAHAHNYKDQKTIIRPGWVSEEVRLGYVWGGYSWSEVSLSGSPCRTPESESGYRPESVREYERMTVPTPNSVEEPPTLPLPLLHSSPDTLHGTPLLRMRQLLSSHHDIAAGTHPRCSHCTDVPQAGSKRPGVPRSVRGAE